MSYTVHVQPSGCTFTVHEDESVLAAALRQGYQFPYACQQAVCGTCRGQLIEGNVHYDSPVYALSEAEREMGEAIFCCAKPLSDLIIYVDGVVGPTTYPVRRLVCDVLDVRALSGQMFQVFLKQPQEEPLQYFAGQYLEVLHVDAGPKPFSIANAPNASMIELHIRHLPQNTYTENLLHEIHMQKKIRVLGPYGAMRYQREPAYPLLFVAGGTGFAPFKAIIEQALRDKYHEPIYLYWGARTRADLYWHEALKKLAESDSRFYYLPVLSHATSEDEWQGETGFVHEWVLKKHGNLQHFHIYASGPPEMVYAAQKAFLEKNMQKEYFYSDLLDYLPK